VDRQRERTGKGKAKREERERYLVLHRGLATPLVAGKDIAGKGHLRNGLFSGSTPLQFTANNLIQRKDIEEVQCQWRTLDLATEKLISPAVFPSVSILSNLSLSPLKYHRIVSCPPFSGVTRRPWSHDTRSTKQHKPLII